MSAGPVSASGLTLMPSSGRCIPWFPVYPAYTAFYRFHFSQVRFHGDKDKAAKVYQGLEALQAQDIADAVLYVTKQPRRVQISDMTIMANQQATGFTIHREE